MPRADAARSASWWTTRHARSGRARGAGPRRRRRAEREAVRRQRAGGGAAVGSTQTLQFFQRTWSRLSADQRLAQSRASLPENAGPLNSHHLVHRALTLMRALSPEYLECFVGYVDALQWLERANEAAVQETGGRKSMAARR